MAKLTKKQRQMRKKKAKALFKKFLKANVAVAAETSFISKRLKKLKTLRKEGKRIKKSASIIRKTLRRTKKRKTSNKKRGRPRKPGRPRKKKR